MILCKFYKKHTNYTNIPAQLFQAHYTKYLFGADQFVNKQAAILLHKHRFAVVKQKRLTNLKYAQPLLLILRNELNATFYPVRHLNNRDTAQHDAQACDQLVQVMRLLWFGQLVEHSDNRRDPTVLWHRIRTESLFVRKVASFRVCEMECLEIVQP